MKKIAVGLLAAFAALADGDCYIEPVKPVIPVGCKDLKARCECTTDKNGRQQCRWVWVCVKEGG